ncbi:MAG TPA: ROK family protein [Edaphobacter sp.]|nr:ROK family protein [Edaphobacter sp.]
MRALALDMGGTHIGCGLVEEDRLLAHMSIDAESTSSFADLLPVVTETLHTLLGQAGVSEKECAGIALGFPGIVNARTTTIYSTLNKYVDAPSLDLRGWAQREFNLPLRIENDARLALMGEHYAGAGRGTGNIVMMTLGTGIGSATILNGRLLRGVHGHAGCLGGHLTAKFDGHLCHCGNIGCAEAEASGWSMPLIAAEWPGFPESALAQIQKFGFRELFTCAELGDKVAREVRERCLHVWAANAVSLIHAYDPEMLIFGGGVMQDPEPILSFVQEYINVHTWSSWGKTRIAAAMLGNSAALLGAVPLLAEEMHGA